MIMDRNDILELDGKEESCIGEGPHEFRARSTKNYMRFVIDGILLIGAMITLLIILLRRQ